MYNVVTYQFVLTQAIIFTTCRLKKGICIPNIKWALILGLQLNSKFIRMLQYMIASQPHPGAAINSQYTQIFTLYSLTCVSTLCMRQHKPCQLPYNTAILNCSFSKIHPQLHTLIGHGLSSPSENAHGT